jgi:hypothetical protein
MGRLRMMSLSSLVPPTGHMGPKVQVRGFNPPHCRSGHHVEGGSFAWHGGGRHDVVAHRGRLGHRDSSGCQGWSLGPRGLCPLWARNGPMPLALDRRAPLGAPRRALEAGS